MVFQSEHRLPHCLDTRAYWSDEAYATECEALFGDAWHFVGTTDELANPGDFLTLQIGRQAVQVRNFAGKISALSNVCAHRHALICSASSGNSKEMQCQYHGWEYQSDGRTGRIPEPKNFAPFEGSGFCLPTYRVEQLGQLVFVNLSNSAPQLEEWLGKDFAQMLAQRFGAEWGVTLNWGPDYASNWKVPIENSLEAYHVPNVHPETFREDPGPSRSDHSLLSNRTFMKTRLPFAPHNRLDSFFQKLEGRFVRWMGYETTSGYAQHHVFPNLLFSFTDAISLVNAVQPTGPTTSRARVRQFGRQPIRAWPHKRLCSRIWGKLTAAITKRILLEDKEIFSSIQQGLECSSQSGVLGICEERIHAFQNYVVGKAPELHAAKA